MKRIVALALCAALLALWCATDKTICMDRQCRVYEPCGPLDADECRDPRVDYDVSIGNVVLSVIFSETLAVPLILIGWYLWEPQGAKVTRPATVEVE